MSRYLLPLLIVFVAIPAAAQQYKFNHTPAKTGQRLWQHVTVLANTMSTYEQNGQKISRRHNYVTKEQIRRVTVLDARPGPANKVRVQYEKAQETRSAGGGDAKITPQAVSGKTYIVMRPEEELEVFDERGQTVPDDEAAIVRENMQFVGRPNPLAQFLHGRTLQVGQQLEVPREIAERMLGWKSAYGQVDKVTITLRSVSPGRTALLDTTMVGKPVAQLSGSTTIKGQLHVALDTCRTSATNLQADLAVHETRGPKGHTFTVSHEGQANIYTQARVLSDSARR